MRRGGRILIILGIVLGLITAAAAFVVVSTAGAGAPAPVATTKVVIAQQNVPMRASVPAAAVTTIDWPSDSVPPGTLTDPTKVVGKLAATPIVAGQLIVPNMVIDKKVEESRKGLGSDASYIVPKGRVAVSFPINQVSGVAGALREGDTVDLLVSYDVASTAPGTAGGATKKQITQIALQNVEILRVGLWTVAVSGESAPREAQMITFLVNRQDALVLKFLRETSTEVQLALRAAGDTETVATEPVILEYVDTRFNFGGYLGRTR